MVRFRIRRIWQAKPRLVTNLVVFSSVVVYKIWHWCNSEIYSSGAKISRVFLLALYVGELFDQMQPQGSVIETYIFLMYLDLGQMICISGRILILGSNWIVSLIAVDFPILAPLVFLKSNQISHTMLLRKWQSVDCCALIGGSARVIRCHSSSLCAALHMFICSYGHKIDWKMRNVQKKPNILLRF